MTQTNINVPDVPTVTRKRPPVYRAKDGRKMSIAAFPDDVTEFPTYINLPLAGGVVRFEAVPDLDITELGIDEVLERIANARTNSDHEAAISEADELFAKFTVFAAGNATPAQVRARAQQIVDGIRNIGLNVGVALDYDRS